MDFYEGTSAQTRGGLGAVSFYTSAKIGAGDPTESTDWINLAEGSSQHPRAGPVANRVGHGTTQLRVLIADDTFTNRRLAELILKHQGHQVVSVVHGGEAVQLARDRVWDVILMDLQMPVMNGWQATQAIRRHENAIGQHSPVPIIAFTAYAVPNNRQRCLDAGMDDILAKPVDAQHLVERVEQWGRSGQAERD